MQVKEPLEHVLCIALNLNKNQVLLIKCCPSGRLRELKNKGNSPLVIRKRWPRSLTGSVAYESFSLQSLSDK